MKRPSDSLEMESVGNTASRRDRSESYFGRRSGSEILFYSVSASVVVLLLALHGLLPGTVGSLTAHFSDYGSMECGSHSLGALLHVKCPLVGGTTGDVLVVGSPVTVAGALILRFTPLSVEWAYSLVAALVMALAFAGTYKLIRSMNVSRYVALTSAALFLSLPLIFSMQSFGGTYWGFLLLPAAIYVVWRFLQRIPEASWLGRALIAVAWVAMGTILVFMDGYSFFMYTLTSAFLILVWAWGKWPRLYVWVGAATFLLSTGIAYETYTSVIPRATSWTQPISVFRAMGLDFVTIFMPTPTIWWAHLLKLKLDASRFWGDGTNSSANYVGFGLLALFIFGVFISRKKMSRLSVALLLVGAASFVLSLGPSLKFDSVRPPLPAGPVTSSAYMMPPSDAVLSLPTGALFTKVPGLDSMRATYRWHALTLLVLVAFAAVAVQMLLDKKRKLLGYFLLAIVCLELLPNPYLMIQSRVDRANQLASFNSDVIDPLKTYIKPGDRILYYPGGVGGNDYLSNYITPNLQAWAYNIGGDKALVIAVAKFPIEVRQLLRATKPQESGPYIKAVLEDGTVDKVVVPHFDLRWDSYNWPPGTQDGKIRAEQALKSAEQQTGLTIQRAKFFDVITLRR